MSYSVQKFGTKSLTAMLSLSVILGVAATIAGCQAARGAEGDAAPSTTIAAPPKADRKGFKKEAIIKYNQGLELYQQGNFNKAIEAYKKAIEIDDRMDRAYCNLGLTYIAQKNYTKAREAINKALSIKPDRAASLNGLASILYYQGKKEEAIEKWQETVKVDKNYASAYLNMGNAMESLGQTEEAHKAYATALTLKPDLPEAFYSLGILMIKEKKEVQALYLLGRAVELSPESEFARDARKQIASLKGQFDKDAGPDSSCLLYTSQSPRD